MSGPAADTEHYLAQYEQAHARLPGRGLAWLEETRRGALERFATLGFPAPREEAWRYTPVSPIAGRRFRLAEPPGDGLDFDRIVPHTLGGIDHHLLVFVDGSYAPALSRPLPLPKGVVLCSLAQALERTPERLEAHLARHADSSARAFTALNTAFLADGAYIHLPRGVRLAEPIELLFLSRTRGDAPAAAHPRNLIVAEEGSGALIIERYAALQEGAYFTNAVTEIFTGPGAVLEHYKLQQEALNAYHIGELHVEQARDSVFISHSISLGGALVRNDLRAVLGAEGADCTLNGLYLAGGRQHVDNHTRIDHAKPHGTSRELYKGILDGAARGVFNGKVVVHPDAQKTDAQQQNKNLLLSRNAEIDTKPELEIYADDVKCTHGATVGQLDRDTLFYLRSRGIDLEDARSLLTYAFATDVLQHVRLAPLRASIERVLVERLPKGERIKEFLL
jgi:Fe-S cluster assembly protein SufD